MVEREDSTNITSCRWILLFLNSSHFKNRKNSWFNLFWLVKFELFIFVGDVELVLWVVDDTICWYERVWRNDQHSDVSEWWLEPQTQPWTGRRSAQKYDEDDGRSTTEAATATSQSPRSRHGPTGHSTSSSRPAAAVRARRRLPRRYVGTWPGPAERAEWRDLAASRGSWRRRGGRCARRASSSAVAIAAEDSVTLWSLPASGRDDPAGRAAARAVVPPCPGVGLRRAQVSEEPSQQRLRRRTVDRSRHGGDHVVAASTSVWSTHDEKTGAVWRAAEDVDEGQCRFVDVAACGGDARRRCDVRAVWRLPLCILPPDRPSM